MAARLLLLLMFLFSQTLFSQTAPTPDTGTKSAVEKDKVKSEVKSSVVGKESVAEKKNEKDAGVKNVPAGKETAPDKTKKTKVKKDKQKNVKKSVTEKKEIKDEKTKTDSTSEKPKDTAGDGKTPPKDMTKKTEDSTKNSIVTEESKKGTLSEKKSVPADKPQVNPEKKAEDKTKSNLKKKPKPAKKKESPKNVKKKTPVTTDIVGQKKETAKTQNEQIKDALKQTDDALNKKGTNPAIEKEEKNFFVVNPGAKSDVEYDGWINNASYKDLYEWGKTQSMVLIGDKEPVTDSMAAFVSPYGAVIKLHGLKRYTRYIIWVDFVRFRQIKPAKISSRLKVTAYDKKIAEFEWGKLPKDGMVPIEIPYELLFSDELDVKFTEYAKDPGLWGVWDIIVSEGSLPETVNSEKTEKPLKEVVKKDVITKEPKKEAFKTNKEPKGMDNKKKDDKIIENDFKIIEPKTPKTISPPNGPDVKPITPPELKALPADPEAEFKKKDKSIEKSR